MFTRMDQGTVEDWMVIGRAHVEHQQTAAPLMIMDTMRRLAPIRVGFAADQLTHCLMTATLARQDGAADEEVVAALCHDIGKVMSIPNHGPIGAETLKPYVSDHVYHAIYWHQHFQGAYYYNHVGKPTDMREQFRAEPWFGFAETLVDKWDMPAFDPDFAVDRLESFEPEVTRVFSSPKRGF